MDKRRQIFLGTVILGVPLTCLLSMLIGTVAGLPEEEVLKVIVSVIPIGLLALILGSYYFKECLYIQIRKYSRDTVREFIGPKDLPSSSICFRLSP